MAWAAPVGSGCRVFRTAHRICYLFRISTMVILLDVNQPTAELKLDVVREVAEMIVSRVSVHVPTI